MRGRWANLRLALASGAVALLGLEAMLRLHPVGEVEVDSPYQLTQFLGGVRFRDPFHSYREVYPVRFDHGNYYARTGGVVDYHFNQLGARWIESAQQGLQGTGVLVVGDSFTLGFGVRYEDSWIFKLERALRREGELLHFVNFAEPGADARRCLQVYREVREGTPHAVLLYGMNLNDLIEFDTSDVATKRKRLPGFSWLRRRSRLVDFVLQRIEKARSRSASFRRLTDPSVFSRPYFTENMEAIVRMKEECEGRGGRFYLVMLPILVDVKGGTFDRVYEGIRQALAERRVGLFDLTGTLAAFSDTELWILPFDQHPNEIANDRFAAALAPLWERDVAR